MEFLARHSVASLQFRKKVQAWGGLVLHDIHDRALRRAAKILGGEEQLRVYLGAAEGELSTWQGQAELPRKIFLRLVDLITEEEVRAVSRR
jgi:hypothetical protein